MDDDDLPRTNPAGRDLADRLSKEDLSPFSLDELDARIATLEAEIARIRAHRDASSAHRKAADALFSAPSPGSARS
jgi:uncharacterized small protein (DUF1192 family)